MLSPSTPPIAIIGAGPAGLMAAEVLGQAGFKVDVFDAMASPGRKFLLAGIGGLNITHGEDYSLFCTRYGEAQAALQPILDGFSPNDLRSWAHALGVETFVGTSGRVFPKEMKAAPLLRAWLHRLRSQGMRLHVRHRWQGWDADGSLKFSTPDGEIRYPAQATLLALGGASWPKLGSDGAWVPWLEARGIAVAALESANCGFETRWSPYLRDKFAGAPLKHVSLSFTDLAGNTEQHRGELILSQEGVEGSLIYAFSRPIRQMINARGSATFHLDLLPDHRPERVLAEIRHPRGARSLSSHLQSRLGLKGVKLALVHEVLDTSKINDPATLAATLKALPITVDRPRPLAEAISTAGGVRFCNLDSRLMLKTLPGTFVAGEMVDWEAPTGGYLLTACLAMGRQAGQAMAAWLSARP